MRECPQCHQSLPQRAVTCPYCGISLTAYGHPGIPLHRATDKESLCASCTYDADDTCTFPQRPHARDCTLYHDISEPPIESKPTYKPRPWIERHLIWLVVLVLVALSILLAL
ncbi:zinc ribbon domain-containing protein [Oscillatoriales cyanobacterium LEGE 11467]|uniref:Zinc ribbon domain-containing protein n=1 Tax=Zarconia navalis LEGE 11467 TaxID=1828826 RepID=A0A928VV40_9CYAN|nr:zinc ribbon domain-containing protein [Zarconia navalis]MBE9040797.1 zinc ribbon domain-containing protein [Zarconia navalis LEGE 11467]